MASKVFINYRRVESLKDARHLATLLDHGALKGHIFIDLKGLDGSDDWLIELERQGCRQRCRYLAHLSELDRHPRRNRKTAHRRRQRLRPLRACRGVPSQDSGGAGAGGRRAHAARK